MKGKEDCPLSLKSSQYIQTMDLHPPFEDLPRVRVETHIKEVANKSEEIEKVLPGKGRVHPCRCHGRTDPFAHLALKKIYCDALQDEFGCLWTPPREPSTKGKDKVQNHDNCKDDKPVEGMST